MNIDEIRNEIPGLEETVYMNTGGTGPSPNRVTDVVLNTFRSLQIHGPDAPPVMAEITARSEEVRRKIASFFNADTNEIALLRSVSEGMNVVAMGLPWQGGDEIILTDQEHPTGLMPWFNLRDRIDIKLKMVELTDDGEELLQRFKDAITPRTKLFSLSHVTAENGLRLPAKAITDLAHQNGVQVIFDGAQSSGQFPIDLHDIGADYYAITSHKWILGGLGSGALYVRRDRLDDLAISWTGSGSTRQLDRVSGEYQWKPNASRFEFGGRAWPLYFGFGEAVDYIQELGVDQIEARAGELADILKRDLSSIPGVKVLSPSDPAMSTGIVGFEIDGMSGIDVASILFDRWKIVCRAAFEGRATRISVAFFTSTSELEVVRDAVTQLVADAA